MMKTTQIILEHLIAGVQMMFWLLLFSFSVLNIEIRSFTGEGINFAFWSVIALSFVYPLGIILDNIADRVLRKPEKKIKGSVIGGNKSMTQLLTQLNNTLVTEQFDYIRIRIRITRSAFVNFFMLTLSSLLFTFSRMGVSCESAKLLGFQFLIGMCLTLLSYYSWWLLNHTYYSKISKRYSEIDGVVDD